MDYSKITKEAVEKIKLQEEEKYREYGITFNIKTPTIIQYYVNNIKSGNFNLKKNGRLFVKSKFIHPIYADGWASGYSNDICVLSKDRSHFFSLSLKELRKNLPFQKMMVTFITLHEIKHIVQNSGYFSSAYEFFSCYCLSDYKGLKGVTDRAYHDSLFSEIDANLYGATEAKKYFLGDKNIEEYFDKHIGKYGLQKHTYDFDATLEEYQQKNEENKCKCYGMVYFEHFIWNDDGTFKRPRDICNEPDFKYYQDEVPTIKEFNNRVIASDAYLSRLNMEELDAEEINFISNAIKDNNLELEKDKRGILDLLDENKISSDEHNKAIKVLNTRIAKKEEYRKELMQRFGTPEEVIYDKNDDKELLADKSITSDNPKNISFNEQMLEPEPRKKVLMVSIASEHLKKLINSISNMKTGIAIFGMAYLAEIASIVSGIGNPMIAATSVLGAGLIASEIYKAKSNRK